ncbi:MAG TPA: hypothetical protein DCL80_06205, partial [Balneola sp.]|nr:hypothetical protein [Balneola sp.]
MKKVILMMAFAVSLTAFSQAQTTVTFNVDMKYALDNGLFNTVTDKIYLKGDISPLGENQAQYLELTDTAPIDSVYSVAVVFPAIYTTDLLTYNFVIERLLST